MSVAPEVNERLAAVTAAGTSVWLDQMRRGMIESGELARMVIEDSLRGVTSNPAIFEKAILGSPDYDADLQEGARDGLSAREIYRRHGRARRAARRRRAPRRLRRVRRRGRLRLARGRAAPGARHRGDDRAGAHVLGPRRPAEPDDQDPRHARGDPGDRDRPVRGHERQRHAALRRRRLRGRDARVHPRDGAPPRRGAAARPSLRRLVLRLARRHRGRQAARGRWATPSCRDAPGSPTPAAPTRRSSASSAATSSPRCARPAARSSARCGRRPASRTRPTPRRCTSTASSGPTPSTRCRCRRCRPPRATGEVTGATADLDPTPDLRGAARRRDRPRRRHRPAAARGHRRVHRPDGQAARRHRGQARGDRHRPPGVVRGRPAARARAARRRAAAQGPRGGRRAPDLAPRRHALGAGRHAGAGGPARLADDRRQAARGPRRDPPVRRRGARRTA